MRAQRVAKVRLRGAVVKVASEAIVVIDIVQSTATSDKYGWYAVGRDLFADLRREIGRLGRSHGLQCMKSTGDGYLLAFANEKAADLAAVKAIRMSLNLLVRLAERNSKKAKEKRIDIRVAVHFGEVDVLPDDREGPNVSYTFRLEAIDRDSVRDALAIPPEKFPIKNYILCSERVQEILRKHGTNCSMRYCGSFKLKGFDGRRDAYLVTPPGRSTRRRP